MPPTMRHTLSQILEALELALGSGFSSTHTLYSASWCYVTLPLFLEPPNVRLKNWYAHQSDRYGRHVLGKR